jgi:hypothetical protein|tara:strand:+ start:193 stop:327 length:135 start_codon:yes stop_codon:yes gene_type:complete
VRAKPKTKIENQKLKMKKEKEEKRKLAEAILAFLKDYRDGKLEE